LDSTAATLMKPQTASSWPLTVSPSSPVSSGIIRGGVTDSKPWERARNPYAGMEELRWFHENLSRLAGYENRWIALLGQKVIAYGDSFEQVHDQLREGDVCDALVVLVPEGVARREYFIG
jgi:hypothetical protein